MNRCTSCFGPVTAGELCANCAAISRSDIALPLGARLQHGRYEIGRTLGEPGGFGVTYLAWDTSLERRIAIKEYFPRHLVSRGRGQSEPSMSSPASQPDFDAGLKGFLDEARRLAILDHPNIVKVHDYCEAFGTGYLVMSYYEGRDLRTHVEHAGDKLDWQEAVSIVLPLLDGLAEVHRAGLIHRDIKPANTYLATLPDGKVRPILIDFGAARWASTTKELTAILTEGFAPLEQYPGCGPQGSYTDVYAVAATLYSVISGRVPASAPSRLTHSYVAHLTDQVPGVPRRLGDAIEQAMAIQFEERPQSAAEFARLLRAASGALTSQLVGTTPRVGPQSARTQPLTTSAGLAPTRTSPRPGLKYAGIAAAVVAVAAAIAVPILNKPADTGPQPGRSTGDDGAARSDSAGRFSRAATTALEGGDYITAMSAATSLHVLSRRSGVATDLSFTWSQRADSVAGVIATACPAERALLLKRDPNAPACPDRGW